MKSSHIVDCRMINNIYQGIGITLEESLIFWRSEFGKVMELDKVRLKLNF